MGRAVVICAAIAAVPLSAPGAAGAAATFGAATLTPAPTAGRACPLAAATCVTVLTPTDARAPANGVVTAWRVHAVAGDATVVLRAMREQPAGWQAVASNPSAQTLHGGTVETFAARLPVQAGDALALEGEAVPGALDPAQPGPLAVLAGPLADNDPARPADATIAAGLLVQADVEPDRDHDGYGDETQDACPDDPAHIVAPCAASLAVHASAPEWGVIDHGAAQGFDVVNAGPSSADGVTLALSLTAPGRVGGIASSQGTCSADAAAPSCALGTLAPGATAHLTVLVTRSDPGEVTTAAALTSSVLDANAADDRASAVTTFTPPSVAPPPIVFPMPPCVNVRIGTFDDEVMDGTAFGDRLVGRGGRDLLEGDGGPDCLEGGTGADVLDGGEGDDRLSGGAGNDRLYGDAGNDRLEGGSGRDTLSGGPGDDLLIPGAGADRVAAGTGNDTVSARDGARDVIDCGPGRDTATVDRVDRVTGCETVTRG